MNALFWLVLLPLVASLRVPVSKRFLPRQGSSNVNPTVPSSLGVSFARLGDKNVPLSTDRDVLYSANITIGGLPYPVQLDTGSSDLWVCPPNLLHNVTISTLTHNLTYGSGWAYGNISCAPMEFAGYSIPQQAFLYATHSNNPVFHFGAIGIMGLGFTSLSAIDRTVAQAQSGATWGRSILYNIFSQNPQEPNYVAFALHRSTDPTNQVEGSFTIGEIEPEYAAVATSPKIPTWPVRNPSRWNVLVDAVEIKGQAIHLASEVNNVPNGKIVVLLDSGTSYSYVPYAIADALYRGIRNAYYDKQFLQWVVPCDHGIHVALTIGGQRFDLHPLDIVQPSLVNSSLCIGSFIPATHTVGAGEFDWIVGDNVLRAVYSVYDFGDFDASGNMGNPYVQLLSLVNIEQAARDFRTVRGGSGPIVSTSDEPKPGGATNAASALRGQAKGLLHHASAFIAFYLWQTAAFPPLGWLL